MSTVEPHTPDHKPISCQQRRSSCRKCSRHATSECLLLLLRRAGGGGTAFRFEPLRSVPAGGNLATRLFTAMARETANRCILSPA